MAQKLAEKQSEVDVLTGNVSMLQSEISTLNAKITELDSFATSTARFSF